MKVTASIVTYNSYDEINNILDCLHDCLNLGLNEVYVVDNNSKDNTVSLIKQKYSWVKLIESKENLGYGKGHNLVIKNLDSDIHFIINPDILVNKEQFVSIVDYMSSNSDISLLCPKVLNVDGSTQHLPKKNPRFKYLLGGMFGLFHKYREEYTMSNELIKSPIEIDFCTGCFMVCRTEWLKRCGGFDDRFFLYFEDADLSRNLKKYGRVIYNPSLFVIHKWKRENKRSLKGIRRFLHSYMKYKIKWRKK